MLDKEIQNKQKHSAAKARKMANQGVDISQLKQQLAAMQAALGKLQSKDQLVAQR
jgi:hypothetical protein